MIYLASSSPRRAELLQQIGVQFKVAPAWIDESAGDDESIEQLVLRLSQEKALAVRAQLDEMQAGDLVLAADTLIGLEGEIIGKPCSAADCVQILSRLSGREHEVVSAVAVVDHAGRVNKKLSINRLKFRPMQAAEIRYYCQTGEPMDKAGAYAIQGFAAVFIEHLSGSYSSVMGLPLFETAQLLAQAGQPITPLE
jgi:septum formation protein